MYDNAVEPEIYEFLQGSDIAVLLYAELGAGKSYTTGTESRANGERTEDKVPRCTEDIFNRKNQDAVSMTYLELYCTITTLFKNSYNIIEML